MACTEAWLKLQPIIKIVFMSTVSAFCSTILGFATPVWISTKIDIHLFSLNGYVGKGTVNYLGIWQACGGVGDIVGCINTSFKDLPAFYVATRVFACFGLISTFITTALVFWYSCISKGETGRALIGSMFSSFISGGLLAITVAIFGAEVGKYITLSFSFAMMCIASILYVVNGVLFLVYLCSGRR